MALADQNLDNRMLWIRDLYKVRKPGTEGYWTEYEIASEAEIGGRLDYGSGSILCQFMTSEPDSRGLLKYLLRLKTPRPELQWVDHAAKDGYFYPKKPIGELLAIFSLFFQCRFYLVATYDELSQGMRTKREHDFRHAVCKKHWDPNVFGKRRRNFVDLSGMLDSIERIAAKEHQRIILACHNYALALQEYGLDDEMIFIRLVSAVEAASGKAFEGTKKPGGKFPRLIERYTDGFAWTGVEVPVHCRIDRSQLKTTLHTIYTARSRYLHEGYPMWVNRPGSSDSGDTHPALAMIADQRKRPSCEKLPYSRWFQNLVRHCLLEHIARLASHGTT